jgi:hypothetical protein
MAALLNRLLRPWAEGEVDWLGRKEMVKSWIGWSTWERAYSLLFSESCLADWLTPFAGVLPPLCTTWTQNIGGSGW